VLSIHVDQSSIGSTSPWRSSTRYPRHEVPAIRAFGGSKRLAQLHHIVLVRAGARRLRTEGIRRRRTTVLRRLVPGTAFRVRRHSSPTCRSRSSCAGTAIARLVVPARSGKRRHPEPCAPTVDHHIGHECRMMVDAALSPETAHTSWGTSSSGKPTVRFGLSTHSPQLRLCRY